MNQNVETHRQGDVLLVKIEALPKEAEKRKEGKNDNVLALGEGSGHGHTLDIPLVEGTKKRAEDTYIAEKGGRLYVCAGKGGAFISHRYLPTGQLTTELKGHDGHNQFLLPEGVYEMRIQREYKPYEKRMNEVID